MEPRKGYEAIAPVSFFQRAKEHRSQELDPAGVLSVHITKCDMPRLSQDTSLHATHAVFFVGPDMHTSEKILVAYRIRLN